MVDSIFVSSGKRTIGYTWPGTLYVDAAMPPTVKYTFEANKSYEIVIDCEKNVQIKLIAADG